MESKSEEVSLQSGSNMRELAEDNLSFEGSASKPDLVQSKLAEKGFGTCSASELTESVLRYNRRDQHLAQVVCPCLTPDR